MGEGVFPESQAISGGPVQLSESGGLTKRELFAAMFLQSMLTHMKRASETLDTGTQNLYVTGSIYMADALLKKLEKKND